MTIRAFQAKQKIQKKFCAKCMCVKNPSFPVKSSLNIKKGLFFGKDFVIKEKKFNFLNSSFRFLKFDILSGKTG